MAIYANIHIPRIGTVYLAAIEEVPDDEVRRAVLATTRLVILEFHSPEEPACRALGAALERLASGYADKLKILRVNTNVSRQWAEYLGVDDVPAIVFFRAGHVVERTHGLLSEHELEERIKSLL